ncbi:putative cellulose-binding protein [Streptomyces avermitilis MA-4680 = NBRC 14893]|uniref:Cellulose-binding protein n=1 Tax=Streptomyces avermitilis (strain ATCC 31267 / DSM 46492 / JCM 5070 / NBRC 14893 / NCIMB 12804 / NRRL 8165 / MA-4680) TaxID=227882 RepID=Q82QF3_STRAW|nr:putative cellulose-binding protein [Streptomyces avermitilis MA-4680 = NBRC 14893]
MTWMKSASQEPINDGDGKAALFPYGYGLTYDATDPTPTQGACTAQFRTVSSWQGGYQAEATVKNTGSAALTGWTVDWDPAGSTITSLWNGSLTTAQDRATVRNAAFNGSLRPGATTPFGFTANGPTDTPAPHCTSS